MELARAFAVLDRDNKGYLTYEDIKRVGMLSLARRVDLLEG